MSNDPIPAFLCCECYYSCWVIQIDKFLEYLCIYSFGPTLPKTEPLQVRPSLTTDTLKVLLRTCDCHPESLSCFLHV